MPLDPHQRHTGPWDGQTRTLHLRASRMTLRRFSNATPAAFTFCKSTSLATWSTFACGIRCPRDLCQCEPIETRWTLSTESLSRCRWPSPIEWHMYYHFLEFTLYNNLVRCIMSTIKRPESLFSGLLDEFDALVSGLKGSCTYCETYNSREVRR